jgi:hypothetical protein
LNVASYFIVVVPIVVVMMPTTTTIIVVITFITLISAPQSAEYGAPCQGERGISGDGQRTGCRPTGSACPLDTRRLGTPAGTQIAIACSVTA